MQDNIRHLIMDIDTNIDFDKVILSKENKEKYNEFINEQNFKEEFKKHGLYPMNRILSYGDSGTGKTYSAKALCNLLKYQMLYIDIGQALEGGDVANNIYNIFKYSNEKGNCMLFFDECDSIAWSRDSKTAEGGTSRRALNSLFQSLDQMNPDNIFICATNLLPKIDVAFERRFDMKLEFRRPKDSILSSINFFMVDGFKLDTNIEEEMLDIVEDRAKLSYDEIKKIVERNTKKAILKNTDVVELKGIIKDIAIHGNIRIDYSEGL